MAALAEESAHRKQIQLPERERSKIGANPGCGLPFWSGGTSIEAGSLNDKSIRSFKVTPCRKNKNKGMKEKTWTIYQTFLLAW
jgi:hypothetical protein